MPLVATCPLPKSQPILTRPSRFREQHTLHVRSDDAAHVCVSHYSITITESSAPEQLPTLRNKEAGTSNKTGTIHVVCARCGNTTYFCGSGHSATGLAGQPTRTPAASICSRRHTLNKASPHSGASLILRHIGGLISLDESNDSVPGLSRLTPQAVLHHCRTQA
jgi:ribosomal protein L37E